MPLLATESNKAIKGTNLISPTFLAHLNQGHVIYVKCEQPLDEITVQVWLLYDYPNLKYCTTLYVRGWNVRQTDRKMDGQMIQVLDTPSGPCTVGLKKTPQCNVVKVFPACHTGII